MFEEINISAACRIVEKFSFLAKILILAKI
jgi:hypothetical protein